MAVRYGNQGDKNSESCCPVLGNPCRLWPGRGVARFSLLAFLLLWAGLHPAFAHSLVFGMLPMESPVTLFKRFAPLRVYLSQRLGRDVVLETAKDYPQHVTRTDQRRYDIVFTAPHFALRALDRGRYEVVASFVKPLSSVVVVPDNSAIHNLHQLAARQIATPPTQAIVTQVGRDFLLSQGLSGVDQPHYQAFRTHNAAYKATLAGQADAAIIANFIYAKAKQRGVPLHSLASSQRFPGVGVLVAKDLPQTLRLAVQQAFVDLKSSPAGRKILQQITQPGYGAADAQQFESLRPYLATAGIGK